MAKTAQEKAQADLDVAERKYKRASDKLEAHKAAAVTLEAEVKSLGEHVDYLKQHPALKPLEQAVADAQEDKHPQRVADAQPEPEADRPSLGF